MTPKNWLRGLEQLEDRAVPATHTWTGAASDNWSDAGNWTGGAPTSNESGGTVVVIPVDDATINQDIPNLTIAELQFTNPGSSTLTLVQPLAFDDAASFPNIDNATGTNLVAGGTINPTGGAAFSVNVTAGGLTIDSVVAGTQQLLKQGASPLTLGGANTYSGGTLVTAGPLLFTTGTALGTGLVQVGISPPPPPAEGPSPPIFATTLLAAGTTNTTLANNILAFGDTTIGSVDDAVNNPAVSYTGTITDSTTQLLLQGGSGGGTTFAGRITGTGGITATATAAGRRVILDNGTANANDFAGPVTIMGDAVLQLGATTTKEQIPDGASVSFTSTAATLGLFQMTETIAGLVSEPGFGRIRSEGGNSTLVFGFGIGFSGTFGGTVTDGAGALGLIKTGFYFQDFTGDITVSRGLTLNSGTLRFAGTVNAAVVATGGDLEGTGTFTGPLTMGGDSTLAPGQFATTGTIHTTGAVTLQAGRLLTLDVNSAAAGQYDALTVVGSATLGGFLQVLSPSLPVGTVLTIVSGPGTVTGTFDGLPEGALVTSPLGNLQFRISYVGGDGNDVTLTVVPGTTTGLVGSDRVAVGQPATFTATVTAPSGGTPTGTVTFSEIGSAVLGTAPVNASGQAIFTTTTLGLGYHTLTAKYSGDSTFMASESSLAFLQVTAPDPVSRLTVSGAADGTVAVYDHLNLPAQNPTSTLTPFAGLPAGVSVRTAAADVDGDGKADIIAVTGPGTPIRVTVISGADNTTVLVPAFDPFGDDFTGGGFVAGLDLDADGKAEIIVSPDQGGGPRVSIFSLVNGTQSLRANFLGIDDASFRGGARVAAGDVNNDGVPDVVVAAGFLGGPRVALFDGKTLFATPTRLVGDFFAFPGSDAETLRNGVFVAVGDRDGDGFADLIFGGGPGGAPRVFALSGARVIANDVAGAQANPLSNFFVAGNDTDRGGVRVAAKDGDGDHRADIVIGSGVGVPNSERIYFAANFTGASEPPNFQFIAPYSTDYTPDGVFVG